MIIDGARSAGTSTPRRDRRPTRRSAIILAALVAVRRGLRSARPSRAASRTGRCAAGSSSRLRGRPPSRARAAPRRGKRRRGRIGRHHDRAPDQLGLAFQRDPPAVRALRPTLVTSAPKCAEHPLGMVAACLALDDRGLARRREPREQHRGLDLRGGDRRAVYDRNRVARALQRSGSRPALGLFRPRAPPSAPADRGCGPSAACGAMRRRQATRIGQPATAPMVRRQPVPALPKSSGAAGLAKPLTPTPPTRHAPPGPGARPGRPWRAWRAAVWSTSSPSRGRSPASRPPPARRKGAPGARSTCPLAPAPGHAAVRRGGQSGEQGWRRWTRARSETTRGVLTRVEVGRHAAPKKACRRY